MTPSIERLRADIDAVHHRLTRHPVFAALRGPDDLRRFMEWHVFAVWDFVSLLKRLQRDLTGISLPWIPAVNPRAARLINEIVLGEETDLLPDGTPISHFQLYLGAMDEVGADRAQIDAFVAALGQGIALEAALARAGLAPAVAAFVRATLNTALQGDLEQVLGSFFYGRENVIPAMFTGLLSDWQISPASAPLFVHYLERHIDVDREGHGPATALIIEEMIGPDEKKQEAVLTSALSALRQREQLWTALQLRLTTDSLCEVAE